MRSASDHPEHLNTPRLIADSAGTPVWKWDQVEPFGIATPDENPSALGAFEFPVRFPGQYADRETGLYQNWYRDFSSQLGRYLQSDPVGLRGGLNGYEYVYSRPMGLIDPTGLWGSEAHHKIIDAAFPGMNANLRSAIKEGSDEVDAIANQFGDTAFLHSMRSSPRESVAVAKAKACAYVQQQMAMYRSFSQSPHRQRMALVALGRALHPIMDSTSPMHEGWQVWNPEMDWVWHGNGHGSLEGTAALTRAKLSSTVQLMKDALDGKPCVCAQ